MANLDKEISEFSVFLTTACLMGITFERWIEMAAIHAIPGDELFTLVFSVCLISSVFATAWLILFMTRNGSRMLAEIAFFLNIVVTFLWIATIAVSSAKYKSTSHNVLSGVCLVLSFISNVVIGYLGWCH